MSESFEIRCCKLVEDLGLGKADDVVAVRPLTGGVASDIGVVDLGDRQICVKFALSKLKVQEDWYAPLHRNRAEYAWLEFAASITPRAVPNLYGLSDRENGFAMEFLPPDQVYNWKEALLQASPPRGEAAAVGQVLGQIHTASTDSTFDRNEFNNSDDFHALRIEPYLLFTATRHKTVSTELKSLAEMLFSADRVLIHGDVSPKNILFRAGDPIVLDAECATMGDPSFDVAFCLNHLVLKAMHLPKIRAKLLGEVQSFWDAYRPHVSWEDEGILEARICALLPALMLARIDGKSPVEYLGTVVREQVRAISIPLISEPVASLLDFIDQVNAAIEA